MQQQQSRARVVLAAALYGALLALALTTLTDWRFRVATVAVVLLFAARTFWRPRNAAPAPWSREADVTPPTSGAIEPM